MTRDSASQRQAVLYYALHSLIGIIRKLIVFLPRDAMQARPMLSCGVSLSVRPSRSWILLRRINISWYRHHSNFSVEKRHGNILTRTPLTGASNAGGVGRNRDSEPISGFIACCQRCDQLWCYQHGAAGPWQVATLIAGSKRRSLLMAGDDDEVFMTRSLNVTPNTTEQHLIARSDKSVAYATNNKILLLTCCIEARHEASRGLFATVELLVHFSG